MPGGLPTGLEIANANAQGVDTANSRGTAVTCGNSAYGAFTQITASTPSDTCWALILLQTDASNNTSLQQSVNIAVGSAGNEKIVAADLMLLGANISYYTRAYSAPLQIPAGSRISAQGYSKSATDTVYVSVILFDGAFTQVEGSAGIDALGWSAGQGTTITTGAANTKGAYAQLVSATARDYDGIFFAVDCLNVQNSVAVDAYLLDIAIGASGSEIPIVPNFPFSQTYNSSSSHIVDFEGSPSPVLFTPIPAGSRIAARAQDIVGSKTFGLTLYGVYK